MLPGPMASRVARSHCTRAAEVNLGQFWVVRLALAGNTCAIKSQRSSGFRLLLHCEVSCWMIEVMEENVHPDAQ